MSTYSLPTPVLSCPKCFRQSLGTVLPSHKFILSGYCRCDTLTAKIFYKCTVCPPNQTSGVIFGFTKHFPFNHKRTQTHKDYSQLFMATAIPTNQLMDITVNDDININVNNNDTTLLSSGNTNNDMEISVSTESIMEPQITFPKEFLSKEQIDLFLMA